MFTEPVQKFTDDAFNRLRMVVKSAERDNLEGYPEIREHFDGAEQRRRGFKSTLEFIVM